MLNLFRPRIDRVLRDASAVVDASASIGELVHALRSSARMVAGSDGCTVIRRRGDMVTYVGEDSIAPLWLGQSFPIRQCVSGMAMLERAAIIIPDIRHEPRVPLHLYLGTFVRSMAMLPIGHPEPEMAMGVYWREVRAIPPLALDRLKMLADAAAAVIDRLESERRAVA